MGRKHSVTGGHGYLFFACIIMTLICGCAQLQTGSALKEANDLFSRGDYRASLSAYERIMEKHPSAGDRVLFEMGIIYAYPRNEQKDYDKSLQCFEKLIRDYPDSMYRHVSERMIFQINNVMLKDRMVAVQQTLIKALQQEGERKSNEIIALRKKKEALEQKIFVMEKGPAEKVLIEKSKRRLTLISKGSVIKTYKIALGGNPNGPKVMQGDNKTPEGTYIIDSRNKDSRYHMSLHISYPNEKDKKRARELGVSPGGDIMIHGLKNGFSKVGGLHTGFDWTKGCIAVTDEEIEEIEMLVPNGTIVEIRP
ncbi:MAG TPA: L,D-transpeptidase family protein [Deltaproteobacteria bacterium]|nr:L,D-transpeptidase family protein [Deltaproteobacteria bacterium]HQI02199.1 L,D-transpeptidase family protein [Deltaproteobacteria bacterium]